MKHRGFGRVSDIGRGSFTAAQLVIGAPHKMRSYNRKFSGALCYKQKWISIILLSLYILDVFGVFTHLYELDFYSEFQYPLEGDVTKYAYQLRFNDVAGKSPINMYNYNFYTMRGMNVKRTEQGRESN